MNRTFLKSYARLHTTYSEVHYPTSIEELKQLFARANDRGRRVSFRGGGYSFDSQSLNDDLVISLRHFNHIKNIDNDKKQITVEPGARWGEIVSRLQPLGLTPFVVVTTGQATAGGTFSGNCLSRNSPVFGKEGKHIERFQFLTLDGELLECSRQQNAELFHAAIGGFGYLGVVTEITYNLLSIGSRTRVKTVARKYENLDDLIRELMDFTHQPGEWNAL